MKCALSFYQEVDKGNMGRALVLSGLVLQSQDDFAGAEEMFKNAVKVLDKV